MIFEVEWQKKIWKSEVKKAFEVERTSFNNQKVCARYKTDHKINISMIKKHLFGTH